MENRGFEREKNLEKRNYITKGQFSKEQWSSYHKQIHMIQDCAEKLGKKEEISILEVGKGNGLVSWCLQEMGYRITTWDINSNLNPTKVINICDIEMNKIEQEFDIVLCAEVLEHIPFDEFENSIQKFSLLAKHYIIITLPNMRKYWRFQIQVPKIKIQVLIPKLLKKYPVSAPHFWEINSSNETDIKSIKNIFHKYCTIVKSGPVFDNLYHYFFVCSVNGAGADKK